MYESPGVYSLNELSSIRRIGQLVMPRLDFNDPDSPAFAEELVRDYGVCGFIIFGGEIEQVRKTTSFLQSLSDIPLLFGIDAERGLGQIISGATRFPFLMSQGALDNTDLLKAQAEITAEEMKYAGLNLLFAPVLDINLNPSNPIVNIRSFGDKPEIVSRLGETFISQVQKNGVLCCCKHFPGHGDTCTDSHTALPVVDKSPEDMEKEDLLPFISAVKTNVSCIMPAHISYPRLDPEKNPATLSKIILYDLLRYKMGFNGLVISDSFRMDALDDISEEPDNAIKAINSGVDIILDPEHPSELLKTLSGREGEIEKSIKKSLNRISFHKRVLNLEQSEIQKPDFKNNRNYASSVCENSVCLLKGDIPDQNSICIYFVSQEKGVEKNFDTFTTYLESNAGRKIMLKEFPQKPDSSDSPVLLFIVSTTVSAWTDYFSIPDDMVELLNGFGKLNNRKILCNFGSPYVVKNFDFFDTVITTFDSIPDCQLAVAKVLLGINKAEGRLPVDL